MTDTTIGHYLQDMAHKLRDAAAFRDPLGVSDPAALEAVISKMEADSKAFGQATKAPAAKSKVRKKK